jgi:hypothetical protein
MANTPPNGPSSKVKPAGDTPKPVKTPSPSTTKTGSEVDMSLPPLADKAEGSDIFSPGGRRGGSDVRSTVGPKSGRPRSDLISGLSGRDAGSDVLPAGLKPGESDVLGHMFFGKASDVQTGSGARGSSQFDDPIHATEPIHSPQPRTSDGSDSEVEAYNDPTDLMARPDGFENDLTQEIHLPDEDFELTLPPATGPDPSATIADQLELERDDIFGSLPVPNFGSDGPSGVNLLEPVSGVIPGGPASGVNLLDPGVSATVPNTGPSSDVNLLGPQSDILASGPSSGIHSSSRLNKTPGRSGITDPGPIRSKPQSSKIHPGDPKKDLKPGDDQSDLFAALGGTGSSKQVGKKPATDKHPTDDPSDMFTALGGSGSGSKLVGGTRSSILPGAKPGADEVSFDLPDNRIKQPDKLTGYDGSGLIDWTQGPGADSDQYSQRHRQPAMDAAPDLDPLDGETEHELDLHQGLMADAAQGRGFTKVDGPAAKPERPPATTKKDVARAPAPKRKPTPAKPKAAPNTARKSLITGIAVGVLTASVAGVGLFLSGAFALQDSRVNAKNYEGMRLNAADLRDQLQKANETAGKNGVLAKGYRDERDKLTADKVKLGEDKLRLEQDVTALRTQTRDATAVQKERDTLAAERTALTADLAAARKKAADAQAAVAVKDQAAADARTAVGLAEAKLTAADAALDAVVKELRAADLIDPKADRSAALAALPAAIKKAAEGTVAVPVGAAAAGGAAGPAGQLATLVKAVTTAREDAAKARADAVATREAADKSLAAAKADAKKTTDALEAKVKTLTDSQDAGVREAVAQVKADLEGKVAAAETRTATAEADRKAAVAAYERKLQDQAEDFRKDLALARAGVMATISDTERRATDRAEKLYGDGVSAYFAGHYADAEAALDAATKADAGDARRWYFLGLARWARGDTTAARDAFKAGAEWESRNAPPARQLGAALERVQGPARQALDAIRP